MTREAILLHVVNHATYHRGHIADMMYDSSVEPPTTDLPVFLRRELVGQRTGYGSSLQSELLRIAKELGYHHVVVKIWAGNMISIRMHQKFGFETVGTQREIGFVNGTWQDVTIMQLVLS